MKKGRETEEQRKRESREKEGRKNKKEVRKRT
jgi:hypothetical protein